MLRLLRWLGPTLVMLFLVVGSTGQAVAQTTIAVRLDPVGDSNVSGMATLTAEGEGTRVSLDVAGLAPGTQAHATMQAGTCASPGASAATLPSLTADANGKATASGPILFRGTMPVALTGIADGAHSIAVAGPSGVVACGLITRLGASAASDGLPATGASRPWLPAGLLLGAGLLVAGGGVLAAYVVRRRSAR